MIPLQLRSLFSSKRRAAQITPLIVMRWRGNRRVAFAFLDDERPRQRIHLIRRIHGNILLSMRLAIARLRIRSDLKLSAAELHDIPPITRINRERGLHLQRVAFVRAKRHAGDFPVRLHRRDGNVIQPQRHLTAAEVRLQHLAKNRLRLRRSERRRTMHRLPRHRRAVFLRVVRLNAIHQLLEEPEAMKRTLHRMPTRSPADLAGAFALIHTHQPLLRVLPAQPRPVMHDRDRLAPHPRRLDRRRPSRLRATDDEQIGLQRCCCER